MTLIQTSKTGKGKIYLYGIDFYQGLLAWMSESMLAEGYISQEDLDNIVLTNDIDFIVNGLSGN